MITEIEEQETIEVSTNTIGKKEGPSTTTKLIPLERREHSSTN